MEVTINLSTEQITILAEKLGYKPQIEDETQPLVGDSYPLIDNPITLNQFVDTAVNDFLIQSVQNRLRQDMLVIVDNIHNQAKEKLAQGQYDVDLMTLDTSLVLQKIIGELTL